MPGIGPDSAQTAFVDWGIPAFGVLLVAGTFFSLFHPIARSLLARPVKLDTTPFKFEITTMTLLVLVGVAMITPSVYLRIFDYRGELDSKQKKLEDTERRLEAVEGEAEIPLTPNVILESLPDDTPVDVLQAKYKLYGHDPASAALQVVAGGKKASDGRIVGATQYKINIPGIKKESVIQRIEVYEPSSGARWESDTIFGPLEPVYTLHRKDHSTPASAPASPAVGPPVASSSVASP